MPIFCSQAEKRYIEDNNRCPPEYHERVKNGTEEWINSMYRTCDYQWFMLKVVGVQLQRETIIPKIIAALPNVQDNLQRWAASQDVPKSI